MKMYYLCVKNLLKLAIATIVNAFERMVFGFRSPQQMEKGEKKHCAMTASGKGRQKGRLHPEGIMAQNRYKGGNEDQTDWEASRSATT